jgi:hypothetical protein
LRLRVFIGALGLGLPFLLMFYDGALLNGNPTPRSSVSAYYYSGGRELFVAALCVFAIFLITYKVTESNLDNTLSILAGAAAVVVAFFPTGLPESALPTPLQDELGVSAVETIHFIAAGTFIGSLAVISFFFGVREGKRPREGRRLPPKFWRSYHIGLAVVIAATLIAIAVTEIFDVGPGNRLFYGEAVAAVAFGLSWLWKGMELDMLVRRAPEVVREADEKAPEAPPVTGGT